MALADMGKPNCALVMVVFQLGKVTWLSALVALKLKSKELKAPLGLKERCMEAFSEN